MPKKNADPNSLEGLYASLKAQFRNNEQTALLTALNNVNQYIAGLRKPDKYKRIPYVTAEDRQRLMQLHEQVAVESEKLLKETKNPEVRKLMDKIFVLSSHNYTNIAGYDPSQKPKSIDTIEEELRALHFYMPGKPQKGVAVGLGKTLSERRMISFLDEKGNKVSGVFTPKRKDSIYTEIADALDNRFYNEAEKTEGRNMLYGLLPEVKSRAKAPDGAILKDENFAALYELMSNITVYNPENHGYTVDEAKLTEYLHKLNPKYSTGEIVNQIGADTLTNLATFLSRYSTQVMANMEQAGISDDSRIDSRNSAMSAVADLLGTPNLLARSRPMNLTVQDENGNPVELEGTFMAEAKGIDLNNALSNHKLLNPKALVGTDGKAIQQLADLQLLDFICGNVDRHMGNIFYQVDEKTGKLTGIQGIDNDCSFGEFVPEGGESRRRLAGLDNMRCISASMAKRVMALKGPTLKYALRGYGLTEKQLDAACKRVELIQERIQRSLDEPVVGEKNGKPVFEKGKIRILEDKDFRNVDMKDLVVNTNEKGKEVPNAKEYGNIFSCAYTAITDEKKRQFSNTAYRINGAKVLNSENRCRIAGLENALSDAGTMKRALKNNWRLFHSSGKYDDMRSAASDLFDYQEKILKRLRLANGPDVRGLQNNTQQLNAIVKPDEVKKMAKLAEKLEKAATAYLKYKKISTGEKKLTDYTTYTQGRIEAAQEVLKIAKTYSAVKPEEADLSKVSERQAKEEIARIKGDAKDPAMRNRPQAQAGPAAHN